MNLYEVAHTPLDILCIFVAILTTPHSSALKLGLAKAVHICFILYTMMQVACAQNSHANVTENHISLTAFNHKLTTTVSTTGSHCIAEGSDFCSKFAFEHGLEYCDQRRNGADVYNQTSDEDRFNQFSELLDRFDCGIVVNNDSIKHRYSDNSNCSKCKDVYKKWLCSVQSFYIIDNATLKACASVCHSVVRHCPYLHPGDDNADYSSDPSFLCNDDMVMEPEDSNNSSLSSSKCYYFKDPQWMMDEEDICDDKICIHSNSSTVHSRYIGAYILLVAILTISIT